MVENIHLMEPEQVFAALGVDAETGLGEEEAASRLSSYGRNVIKTAKEKLPVSSGLDRFMDLLSILLIAAVIISAILNSISADSAAASDAITADGGTSAFSAGVGTAIAVSVLLCINMIISISIDSKTEKTVKKLKNAFYQEARVLREGEMKRIDARLLTIGDIVALQRGDCVPADLRIVESYNLKTDESSVTGESLPVSKKADAAIPGTAAEEGKKNIALMGTVVTYGRGTGVVCAAGMETELGRKHFLDDEAAMAGNPIQDRLNSAARSLSVLCIIICAVIFTAGILYDIFGIGHERGMLDFMIVTLSLLLAAAPRGITSAALFIMAVNVRKMAASNVYLRDLKTVLTLGKTAVICAGKTGIFTRNIMTVSRVADSENIYEVTGVGYKAKGYVQAEIMITRNIALMAEIAVLCNNAEYDIKNSKITGDPTEGAMLVFGAKLGHDKKALGAARPRIHEIPFDPQRRMMSTYNRDGGRVIMYTKGAAEEIIRRSSYVYLDGEIAFMSDVIKAKLLEQGGKLAAGGLRILACGYKVYNSEADIDNAEEDLTYVGMMAIADTVHEEIRESVELCGKMGISVKLITGDHKETARAIGCGLGLIDAGDDVPDGSDIDALTDEQLGGKVKTTGVFARIAPKQKLRIVAALRAADKTAVAVAGRSADDVPSLERADISIAMGATGKDTVKKTADIIVGGDRFAGIVYAVEHGRTTYANIKKSVKYMLSFSIAMMLLLLTTLLPGIPAPLAAQQMLFLYIVAGILPALAIGTEVSETGASVKRPRHPEETILNRRVINAGMARGMLLFAGAFTAFLYGYYIAVTAREGGQLPVAVSMCFFTFTAGMIFSSYPAKTDGYMLSSGAALSNKYLNAVAIPALILLAAIIYTPGLNALFATVPLGAVQIIICCVIVAIMTFCIEITKLHSRR